ncbi:hypothetical protein POX_a00604 [Penicillium oxalicum]|uniref:hypothetical protein n=1 Tax=Penicillium oxalicum TaxID=69781 RepID=UPI0020B7B43C|nr:hypothetical protein POX_a00604 [Penicillium oxalicum]KAI2794014.1 hypothetical protein POX_a00604 [Penicillium oxalicum]
MEKYLELRDMWEIPREDRGAVYKELHARLLKRLHGDFRDRAKAYLVTSKLLQTGKLERDCAILRTAKLIGMTTTGLSKYRGLTSAMELRVVLIEEAAEVIEASVAAACFESLQHSILVGDHKQLKESFALHELAGEPFYPDVSMFERLIQNNFPFVMLQEQRRMAPEIRQLLTPIYEELHDHHTVSLIKPVPGMGNLKLFFFTHSWPEVNDNLTSEVNEIEALMVFELFVFLCASGTSSQNITILTFYNGQRKKILKMLLENENTRSCLSTAATVDSYQGEENDVVIFSLVRSRSSQSDGIGFLGIDNRVCLALSRARRGLYMLGNAAHLAGSTRLIHNLFALKSVWRLNHAVALNALVLGAAQHTLTPAGVSYHLWVLSHLKGSLLASSTR